LNRQTENDRERAGGGEQAPHRQLQHECDRAYRRGQKHQRTEHVLKQPLLVPRLGQHRAIQHDGHETRALQPPHHLQHLREQMAQPLIGPGRRAQRVHAVTEQHVGRQPEHERTQSEAKLVVAPVQKTPGEKIEDQDAQAEQHTVS
jgi:hypothetical protein